ncbi:NAD+ synthase [Halococcus sp. PRR34]|uniref:NAD+ synthase n=1 Tax=Halococcus sp. PRR34 TaxID=3020830 RepID=UPI0023621636|nr:NAD+ synthase [Halococcus sp. PRR34]
MNRVKESGEENSVSQSYLGQKNGFLTSPAELQAIRSEVVTFIRDNVEDTAVVAMSGGIDSTLTAALAVEAIGSENVMALSLPCKKTDDEHTTDVQTIAEGLGVEYHSVSIRPLLDLFEDHIAPALDPAGDRGSIGNVMARMRMMCAYYASNAGNRRVLGTSNRSELLLGYFTKHGDGAADLYPLGEFYKTEVHALADFIGLPQRIVHKEPTAGLWTGQTDKADLGASYDVLDPILRSFVDEDASVATITDEVDVPQQFVEDIVKRYYDNRHKRSMASTLELKDRESSVST